MKNTLLLILASNMLFFSCSDLKKTDPNTPEVIHIVKAFNSTEKIKLSDVATQIEYIPLQTTEASLISKNMKFYANDIYLLAVSFRKILLFDRKSGDFIREIGEYGKGPDSYNSTIGILPFNEKANTVYALGKGKKIEYSLNGKIINSIKLPPMIFTTASIDESKLAGFVPNFFGKQKNKINIFTADGTVSKAFPNYLTASASQGMIVYKPNGWFHRRDGKLYFYELFNDTLFHVTPNKLIPRYVFDMGKFLPPYEKQTSLFPRDEYFMFKSIHESSNFLFYSFKYEKEYHTMVYDKEQKEVFKSDYLNENGSGFNNDIDDVFPINISGINKNNELIGYAEAYQVVQWIEENPAKSANIPPHLKKLKFVKKMDNPVIMIVDLK